MRAGGDNDALISMMEQMSQKVMGRCHGCRWMRDNRYNTSRGAWREQREQRYGESRFLYIGPPFCINPEVKCRVQYRLATRCSTNGGEKA